MIKNDWRDICRSEAHVANSKLVSSSAISAILRKFTERAFVILSFLPPFRLSSDRGSLLLCPLCILIDEWRKHKRVSRQTFSFSVARDLQSRFYIGFFFCCFSWKTLKAVRIAKTSDKYCTWSDIPSHIWSSIWSNLWQRIVIWHIMWYQIQH